MVNGEKGKEHILNLNWNMEYFAPPAMWLLAMPRLQKLEGEREDRRIQFGLGFGPPRHLKNCKVKGGCVHKTRVEVKKGATLGIEPRIFFRNFNAKKIWNLSMSLSTFFYYQMVVVGGWTTSLPLSMHLLRPDNPFG